MKRPRFLATIAALAGGALVPAPARAVLRSPLQTTCAAEARAKIEAWTGALIGGEWRMCMWQDSGREKPDRIEVVTQMRGHLTRFTFIANADGYRSRWERVIQIGPNAYINSGPVEGQRG
jgi:hypothetical protein